MSAEQINLLTFLGLLSLSAIMVFICAVASYWIVKLHKLYKDKS